MKLICAAHRGGGQFWLSGGEVVFQSEQQGLSPQPLHGAEDTESSTGPIMFIAVRKRIKRLETEYKMSNVKSV